MLGQFREAGVSASRPARRDIFLASDILIVHASGVIWPVECETVADEPLAQVSAVHTASCDGASVLV
jgi:hypothetical protein